MKEICHITFTGVDARTDLRQLQKLQNDYPLAEFGILTSYHWNENGNRYLNPAFLMAFRGIRFKLALHVCGSATKDAVEGNWDALNEHLYGCLCLFNRIQLNVSSRENLPKACAISAFIGQEIIIQQKNKENLSFFLNSSAEHEKQPYSVLLDASGGRGIDNVINVYESEHKVGYAGGISPENVEDKLAVLLANPAVGKFWIDMESGVRTDDWFDLAKVEDVLKKCYALLRNA